MKLSRPVGGLDVAVLKRVAVPDKEALTSMRTEVETMVRLGLSGYHFSFLNCGGLLETAERSSTHRYIYRLSCLALGGRWI